MATVSTEPSPLGPDKYHFNHAAEGFSDLHKEQGILFTTSSLSLSLPRLQEAVLP